MNGLKRLPPAPALQLTSSHECIKKFSDTASAWTCIPGDCMQVNKKQKGGNHQLQHLSLHFEREASGSSSFFGSHIQQEAKHPAVLFGGSGVGCSERVSKGKKENYFHHFRINYT